MYLYRFNKIQKNFVLSKSYVVKVFKPKIFSLQKHGHFSFIYILWYLSTFGKYQIIYVYDKNKLVHYSHIIPRFWKFQFMEENDLEIGPSWTNTDYRGEGIYPFILNFILDKYEQEYKNFYMIVNKTNTKSIRGIEKAGFVQEGEVQKRGIFGIYYRV